MFILIWILLGLHSVWYLIHLQRKKEDFNFNNTENVAMIILSFLFPIASHIATFISFTDFKKIGGKIEKLEKYNLKKYKDEI